MYAARLLTPMQVMMLKEATEVTPSEAKNKAIDEIIELLKKQTPEKFFHYTKDGKPDPAMRERVFYDEPYSLSIAKEEYAEHKVPFTGSGQAEIYKARNKALIVNHKKIKGEK
jgi:hypothetical protein